MNTNAICPISNKKVDENIARLNGGFTVLLLLISFVSQNIIPVLILLLDFLMRSFELSSYSPFTQVSKFILKSFNFTNKPVNAGPKVFASRIGFIFSLLLAISIITDNNIASYIIGVIFGFCAFLEAVFGFCVACQIYPLVYKFTNTSKINA